MNLIKPKPTVNSYSIWILKRFINNLNHNGFGYLTLLTALYILTPLPVQLNTWPVIRQRLITLLELPIKAIDNAIAIMEDN
jgi:hypothetical protein